MQITDIKIRRTYDSGPMRAIVSVSFDDCFAVHDIKVIFAQQRYFTVMPSYKNPNGTHRDIVHPTSTEFRQYLESEVLTKYFDFLNTEQTESEESEKDAQNV